MARVLLILSIVLTLVTAGLGFVAKQKVDALSENLKTTTGKLHQTETTLTKTKDDLAATKKELETAKQEVEEKTAEATKAKAEADDASKKLAEATASLEAKTKELADAMEKFKVQPGVDPAKAVADYEQTKKDLERATADLAEAKQLQQTLQDRATAAEEKATRTEATVNAYKYNITKNGLSGKVLAYNPGWNFVVLSIGDRAGLKSGANMVVQRGNTMIAKVKVSTVEPNTAIADVVAGSMRGNQVQPGDTVIYEGTR